MTKINELKDGMRKVDIEVEIIGKGDSRTVKSKFSSDEYQVCDLAVKDETGVTTLTLWNEQIDQVNVGDKVRLEWQMDERRRVLDIMVIEKAAGEAGDGENAREGTDAPKVKAGTLVGVVTEKGDAWIRVKPEEGESQRFMPRWIGGKDGGLDKEMVRKIGTVRVGDKVRVEWVNEERLRVVALEILERSTRDEK